VVARFQLEAEQHRPVAVHEQQLVHRQEQVPTVGDSLEVAVHMQAAVGLQVVVVHELAALGQGAVVHSLGAVAKSRVQQCNLAEVAHSQAVVDRTQAEGRRALLEDTRSRCGVDAHNRTAHHIHDEAQLVEARNLGDALELEHVVVEHGHFQAVVRRAAVTCVCPFSPSWYRAPLRLHHWPPSSKTLKHCRPSLGHFFADCPAIYRCQTTCRRPIASCSTSFQYRRPHSYRSYPCLSCHSDHDLSFFQRPSVGLQSPLSSLRQISTRPQRTSSQQPFEHLIDFFGPASLSPLSP